MKILACDLGDLLLSVVGARAIDSVSSRWPLLPMEASTLGTKEWTFGALLFDRQDDPSLAALRACADLIKPHCAWFFIGCVGPTMIASSTVGHQTAANALATATGHRIIWANQATTLPSLGEFLEDLDKPGCMGWCSADTPFGNAQCAPVLNIEVGRPGDLYSRATTVSAVFVVMCLHERKGLHEAGQLQSEYEASFPDHAQTAYHLMFVDDEERERITFLASESDKEVSRC